LLTQKIPEGKEGKQPLHFSIIPFTVIFPPLRTVYSRQNSSKRKVQSTKLTKKWSNIPGPKIANLAVVVTWALLVGLKQYPYTL
jgi:hypothetical protein